MTLFSDKFVKQLQNIMDALHQFNFPEGPTENEPITPNSRSPQNLYAYKNFVNRQKQPLNPEQQLVKSVREILVNANLPRNKDPHVAPATKTPPKRVSLKHDYLTYTGIKGNTILK